MTEPGRPTQVRFCYNTNLSNSQQMDMNRLQWRMLLQTPIERRCELPCRKVRGLQSPVYVRSVMIDAKGVSSDNLSPSAYVIGLVLQTAKFGLLKAPCGARQFRTYTELGTVKIITLIYAI